MNWVLAMAFHYRCAFVKADLVCANCNFEDLCWRNLQVYDETRPCAEILNLLKVLSLNPGKFKVTQELISKAGDILREIKTFCINKNSNSVSKNECFLKLAKSFEDEFSKFSQKSTENIYDFIPPHPKTFFEAFKFGSLDNELYSAEKNKNKTGI